MTEENEGQVSAFLSRHPDYAVRAYRSAWVLPAEPPSVGDYLALTPARHGTDGFFAAVLERRP